MPEHHLHTQLAPLYETYNNVIKPLIAAIEARYERFPTPIFNELRAFNDHVARCYSDINDATFVSLQVSKAKSHIERIVLDCYKHLNVNLFDITVKSFERSTANIDLTHINDGDFYHQYKLLRREIENNIYNAKLEETKDNKEKSINLYQEALNKNIELEEFILNNHATIKNSRTKFRKNKTLQITLWVASVVASGIISVVISKFF